MSDILVRGNFNARNLLYALVFCYFVTLSADVLHVEVALFKIKVNHLFAVVLFIILGVSKEGIVAPKEILVPFVCIFASLVLSSFNGIYVERCLGYVAVYLFEFAVYFLVPFTLLFHFDLKKIIKCYFLSFVAMGLYAFCQLMFSMAGMYLPLLRQVIDEGGLARPHGLSYEPSFYALYMCPFVMFVNARYLFSKEKQGVIYLLFVNALFLLSTSTSAFFAYGFFIPLSLALAFRVKWLYKRLVQFGLCIACFLSALFVIAPQMVLFFFKFFIFGFFTHHSFAERWVGIVNAWSVFCQHPFFGVGIGGIGPYLFYRDDVGIFPHNSFGLTLQQAEQYDPKNVATEILAGLGLFGVVAFSILGWTVWKSYQRIRELNEEEEVIARSLFISL
ncbi:MAG: O-antigen ligase family protein, partial [Chlamydiota bacterium]